MKITGRATVYGNSGAIAITGIASPSDELLQSANFSKDFEFKDTLYDPATNELEGKAYAREMIAGDIEFIPVALDAGNTIANAENALYLPDLPFKVTLSGMADGTISGANNKLDGEYVCDGPVTQAFTPGGRARVTMRIWRYTDSGFSATTFTTALS